MPYTTAAVKQDHVDIFPEYFEHGEEGTVANFDKKYYRSVEQVNKVVSDSMINCTWYDGSVTNAINPKKISFKQPLAVSVDDHVLVLILSNSSAEYDNHYLPGVVTQDYGDHTYEIAFVVDANLPRGGGSTPTKQHVEFLFLPVVQEETLPPPIQDPITDCP